MKPAKPGANGEQLFIYAQYAYEWDNYLGATNEPKNESRDIRATVPLQKKFGGGKHLLGVGVHNNNAQPVQAITLTLTTPRDVAVDYGEGVVDAECPPSISWRRTFGWTYSYAFREIDNGAGLHACRQLALSFSKPNTYTFSYVIKARGLEGKQGTFSVVMLP